jgi:hypothetical protein
MIEVDIYFDLKTTGISTQSEIIQIGAVHENGATYTRPLLPQGDIEEGASFVNGFTKRNGRLFKDELEIENALSPRDGLFEFLDWIKTTLRMRTGTSS